MRHEKKQEDMIHTQEKKQATKLLVQRLNKAAIRNMSKESTN